MRLAALRARSAGHRQRKTAGDPWQLGGTLVVAPGDRLLYAWRNRTAYDDAPIAEVLAALRHADVGPDARPTVPSGVSRTIGM